MANFAERMTALRTERGLKKVDVANGTGLDRSTITKYELGLRDNPTSNILETISKFFNVSIDYLTGNSDIKEPGVNRLALAETFNQLNDRNKVELVKYAKYLLGEQENGKQTD